MGCGLWRGDSVQILRDKAMRIRQNKDSTLHSNKEALTFLETVSLSRMKSKVATTCCHIMQSSNHPVCGMAWPAP